MMRQHLLSRVDAPQLWAIIDETAFRKLPTDVATDQIRHLIAVQRPSLRIQVLPDAAGPHAGMDGSFVILDFAEDPSVVYVEQAGGNGLLIEEPEQITTYESVLDRVQTSALSVEASRTWLEDRLSQIE